MKNISANEYVDEVYDKAINALEESLINPMGWKAWLVMQKFTHSIQ